MHFDVNCPVDGGLEKRSAPYLKPCFGGEISEAGEMQVLRRFGICIANWRQFFAYPLGLSYFSFRHVYQMGFEFKQSCREFDKEAPAIRVNDGIDPIFSCCARDFRQ